MLVDTCLLDGLLEYPKREKLLLQTLDFDLHCYHVFRPLEALLELLRALIPNEEEYTAIQAHAMKLARSSFLGHWAFYIRHSELALAVVLQAIPSAELRAKFTGMP